jgi:tRNA(fMet)-specific endonuclease VapC
MILLDTDHVSVLKYPENPRCARLTTRMAGSADQNFATTVITVEEQMRGWLTEIKRSRTVVEEIDAYDQLAGMVQFFTRWQIVRYDEPAADHFERLRQQKVRIGTMDLKIAAIALANDALLLSANRRDYEKVPGLRVENWLA